MQKSILILIFLFFMFSCKHQPLVTPDSTSTAGTPTDTTSIKKDPVKSLTCNTDTAYFTDILPIFTSNCAFSGCHNAASRQSGYELDSYASIISHGIIAGNALNSVVYQDIASGYMPLGGNLPSAQTALIKKWIDQGAKNNACTH
jgi:hypothetical protein